MKKATGEFPAGKLPFIIFICVCSSVGIFLFHVMISAGNTTWRNATQALLFGMLVFAVYTAIHFYSLYKTANQEYIKLKRQSSVDRLTELYNRSYLEPILEGEVDTARKENQQVSVMMVDMDHFKEINDTYGHIVGDQVLAIFAQVVLKCLRKTDIIARYGGDEFIVVLPNTDTDTARAVAERIRNEVSGTYIPPIDGVVISSIHCSIGISNYPVLSDSKSALIKTSDLALYMAKRSGRNCTRVYAGEPALG